MFEIILDEEERGQVGIGTLIVFIAMVLVAAIAAGVLINTAGFLQTQAEATGEESTSQVSDRIEVVSSVGTVNNSSAGTLDEIRITVAAASGSGQIDLNETTLQIVGNNGQANYVHEDDSGFSGMSGANFTVRESADTAGNVQNPVLNSTNRYTIVLDPNDGEAFDAFGESDDATVDIVAPSSATTSLELRSPDLYSSDDQAVRL